MTPEEFEKLKEAEKEHLRKLKQLKSLAREAERKKRLADAMQGMTDEKSKLFDEHEKLLEQLQQESALQEARMEIALESAAEDVKNAPVEPPSAELEEAVRKARAKSLVESMKSQLGAAGMATAKSESDDVEEPVEPSVSKTIGRARVSDEKVDDLTDTIDTEVVSPEEEQDEADEASIPEKTIGRVRRKK